MEEKKIKKTADFARDFFKNDYSGHDWWHTYRVWQLAKTIAETEKAETISVQLAALLHDVADPKLNNGDEEKGVERVREWLRDIKCDDGETEAIIAIIKTVSFKGAGTKTKPETLEAMIVQDADRLDAIGAIGIARAFAFGGVIQRELYNPEIKPVKHSSYEEYKQRKGTSINHFYEKMLLLKTRMNTASAKKIAGRRHNYLVAFLKEFYEEWDGRK